MINKKELTQKWELTKTFVRKFFNLRQLAYVYFTYEINAKHKAPKRETHMLLARVKRNATAKEVEEKLFKIKPAERTTIRVLDVKLVPITELPQV